MRAYDLTHLTNAQLLHDLTRLVIEDRERTAFLLAHLAEVQERRLFVTAGFPSMHAYCVERLGFSDDAAYNRVHAARAARRLPALYDAIADGTLHLTAVRLIAPHVTAENLRELVDACAHRSKPEIQRFLARRFSLPETSAPAVLIPGTPFRAARLVPERVVEPPARLDMLVPERVDLGTLAFSSVEAPVDVSAPDEVPASADEAPEHFRLHVTIEGGTYDKLRQARQLLSHAVPTGDVAAVLDRALDALIAQLEKKKFGSSARRTRSPKPSSGKRYIPLHVRREVRQRDGRQCTFLSPDDGTRCSARRLLEFDHLTPIARGGKSTTENLRLRCRTHNQYEAEKLFGERLMREKRDLRRTGKAETRSPAARDEPPMG